MARFYYTGPSAEELEKIGITLEDVGSPPPVELWAENQKALELFIALDSQWRTGFNGRTGLDYNVLPVVFDLHGVEEADRKELFPKLQIMEREALKIFHTK